MTPIECHSETMRELTEGPVVAIWLRGVYPCGSLGNGHASTMRGFVVNAIDRTRPTAVLFDLTALEYEWSDAIATILFALRAKSRTFPPHCIVAQGATRAALASLLPAVLWATGGKLLESKEEGMAYLLTRVGAKCSLEERDPWWPTHLIDHLP